MGEKHRRYAPATLRNRDPILGVLKKVIHSLDPKVLPNGGTVLEVGISINMIHISPWESCLGLMAGVGRILPTCGILYLYGPFRCQGEHTAPSNAQFDATLRAENPAWGVRDLEEVVEVAAQEGLRLQEVIPMPANNLSVVLRRK